MDLEGLWRDYDRNGLERGIVAALIYQQYQYDGVHEDEIKEFLQESDIHVSLLSIDQYISQLERRNWIKQTEEGGYRLTEDGRNSVELRLSEESRVMPESEEFVNPDIFSKPAYKETAKEINLAYYRGLYDAVAVLFRKLLEDLLFQIIEKEVDDHTKYMFTDDDGNPTRVVGIGKLIALFKENSENLKQYDREIDRWKNDLSSVQNLGNVGAHNIRFGVTSDELADIRDDAVNVIERLEMVRERYERDEEDEQNLTITTDLDAVF